MTAYELPLTGYAYSILNDADRARDVVQETFIKLCRQDHQKVSACLKTWLFTVCRNSAFDILRKNKHTQRLNDGHWETLVASGMLPDQTLASTERYAAVLRALSLLSDNQREVITLKVQQGLSYMEISAVTGLTSGNIGFLIHTGLRRLRELLPTDIRD